MKYLLLIFCIQLALFSQIKAQNAMKNLLSSVKDQIKKASDDVKTQVKSQASDVASQVKEQVKAKASDAVNQTKGKVLDAVADAKGKILDETNNQLNNIVIVSQKNLAALTPSNTKTTTALVSNNTPTATTIQTVAVSSHSENVSEPIAKNILQPNAIEEAMQRDYPLFYKSYVEMQQNDPTIKDIIFGYKEDHPAKCLAYPQKGIIFFDLFYF